MATAVQQAPMQQVPTMQQVAQPPGNDQLHTRHYNIHGSRMQQTQPLYSLCVPAHYDENNVAHHNNIFKQINIIPGFDAANSIVDTGVKLFRPNGTSQLHLPNATMAAVANEFDGKRMRRSIQRRTVDYNASTIQHIKHRLYKRSVLQNPISQPDVLYYPELNQPSILLDNPMNSVTTRFVRASTNKVRCPVFSVAWTPEGRRVVTGTSSGEFTLWNGLTFNFETILQAHDSSVRAMQWSHNDMWLLSGDHNGVIKYWQSNMNNVKMTKAHTDPIRGVGFCPTDNKFVTCSDDGLIKLWDFYRCQEERTLRGHGADVKCIGWHPFKSLVASGSKDSQQPLKIWDPRSGASLATIHGHKSTVMDLHWNKNGNWLLTGSRDRLLKVFDIRVMKEIYTFRGHKKEAASVNWHPLYEKMFASGGSDGAIMFWQMGCEKELAVMENAHDGMIWDLQWHPLGHILCSGSNDHTTKFWTRNRPGDKMRDKYNLNVLPPGVDDDYEYELPNSYTEESQPVEESQEDTDLYDSMVHESVTEELPSEVINSPLVKSLIAQTSMEVQKPETKETPAQIFTVSRQKSGRLKFRVDETRQKRAMDEAERILQEKEEILAKGVEFAQNAGDNSGAPSLLDLDIAPPPFLKTREWDDQMKDVPCIEDIKRQQKEEEEKKAKELAEKNKNMPPPPVTNNNNTNNWQGNYQNNYNYNNGMPYDNRMPDNYNHPPPPPYNNGQYNGPPPPQPPPQQHGGPPMHHGPPPPPQHPGPPQQQHYGPPPAHYNNPPPSHYGGPPLNNNYDGHFNGPPKNGNNYNGQNYDGAPPQKKERFDNRNRWQEVGGRR